jgi:hypothetical protein
MAQVVHSSKSKVEIILDVSLLNLMPCMTIMFLVHSFHLPKVTVKTNNRGEFKQNITIKCGQNATNIFYAKVIIVQISQLRASMRNKRHCPKIIYYTQHRGNVSNGILGISRNWSRMTCVQRRGQWAERNWRCSILIKRIAQIYEQRLRIDTF